MADSPKSKRIRRIEEPPRRSAQMRVEGSAGKAQTTAAGTTTENRRKFGEPTGKFTVFLDRDGVFNVNPNIGLRFYRNLRWLPGAREAFARLNRPDVQTCLCTNQPWVGLLTATPGMIHRLHRSFVAELERVGGRMGHVEAAFAHPLLRHRRTKPNAGMLEDGAEKLAADPDGSPVDKRRAVMVGDKIKDAQAAAGFGVPAILLATTYTAAQLEEKARRKGVPYAAIVPDLEAAVDLILSWVEAAD
jgi:D-glycero-D-manno-heptose 1,7-bisphosphate phosphatase